MDDQVDLVVARPGKADHGAAAVEPQPHGTDRLGIVVRPPPPVEIADRAGQARVDQRLDGDQESPHRLVVGFAGELAG
jgi:hypothetical protein